jgi:uncharacterized OsmC-like protein
MLLEALVACAGVAMKAAATVLDIPLQSGVVSVEGDVDLRGTLGVDERVPVGFTDIRIRFTVATNAPKDKVDELLRLTERYCVVYHTLLHSPRFDVRMAAVRDTGFIPDGSPDLPDDRTSDHARPPRTLAGD